MYRFSLHVFAHCRLLAPKLVEESISHYSKHSIGRSDFLRINNMFNAAISEDLSFLDENASDIWPFGDLTSRIHGQSVGTLPGHV